MIVRKVFIYSFLWVVISCQEHQEELTSKQIVEAYFVALNNYNFEEISAYTSDNILRTEGEYVVTKNKVDLQRIFQWDSVFVPKYEILEIEEKDQAIVATISKNCKRITFLHDTPMVYKTIIEVTDHKITKMKTDEYIEFDDAKWQKRRDMLVKWIDENHPELNGFIHDQTIVGAQNYLKAIALYQTK
ncbi:MAG: hypothetical protein KTR26_00825 [Flammeovirgaceae bacterium]|nr:hypothetical protein [Flammeovirgaceae bacterium]